MTALIIAFCLGAKCGQAVVPMAPQDALQCRIAPAAIAQSWCAAMGCRVVAARCADASEREV